MIRLRGGDTAKSEGNWERRAVRRGYRIDKEQSDCRQAWICSSIHLTRSDSEKHFSTQAVASVTISGSCIHELSRNTSTFYYSSILTQ